MSQLGCLLIGLAVVVGVSAGRKFKQKKVSDSLQVANTTEDECDVVTGAIHRNCYQRFGLVTTCYSTDVVCKCAAGYHIAGQDLACSKQHNEKGRKFDPKVLHSKGCVCVKEANKLKCSFDAPQVCDQCKYAKKSANVATFANMNEKADETFPIRLGLPAHNLPEELQGVFWLSDQKSSSALVSFGQSDDGGGLSSLDANTFIGKVRVSGDRVWSFADVGGSMDAAFKYDLVYEFRYDSATHPTRAEIIPSPQNIPLRGLVGDILEKPWILSFTMDLLNCASPKNDEEAYDCSEEGKYLDGFDKSFVWQRKSTLFKQALGGPANYKAVQVIKADGTKLPAFKHWMDYAKTEETGGTPGVFHWYQIDNDKHCK